MIEHRLELMFTSLSKASGLLISMIIRRKFKPDMLDEIRKLLVSALNSLTDLEAELERRKAQSRAV